MDFWKKGRNQQRWANVEVLRCVVGIPRNNVGPRHGLACPCRGMAEMGLDKPWVRCDVATIHNMEIFVFCFYFAILLFQGLIYWTTEDPIRVERVH